MCIIAGMADETAQDRPGWDYRAVLVSLLVAMVLQSIFLPCLCYEGTVKGYMAGAVDILVVLRLIVARVRKERSKGWIFYAILPFLIIPVILLVVHFWGPK